MIAGMNPARMPGTWHFCTLRDPAPDLIAASLATLQEPEGVSLILPQDAAARQGLPTDMPMAHIVLQVHSALDGVGLTAAVSTALAASGIPCNIVAGFHHDHLFVPVAQADKALALLRARAAQ